MIGLVLVMHEPLGGALANCAGHVMGPALEIAVCDIYADQDVEADAARVVAAIESANKGQGVLVLTDMVGATPSNIATRAVEKARADGVPCSLAAGVNLPMLLRALNYRDRPLAEVLERALSGASQAVLCVDR